MTPLPDLVLYARPACSLCDEAREAIRLVIDDRRARELPVPNLIERNIEDDPDLHRRFLERIPVVELGDQRVELVVTVGKLRRILAALDEQLGADEQAAVQGGERATFENGEEVAVGDRERATVAGAERTSVERGPSTAEA